ncbi:unnamed protein product [Angiostrongylus costaricensis]|uniref:SET domain-containing protein n=1 Tax=Angiostrongylus costaricensis TaxID=334426 RepID=A0A158PJQ2_ANGCS|nr:unnamed protein product [Angiostrongylus costaricensis]
MEYVYCRQNYSRDSRGYGQNNTLPLGFCVQSVTVGSFSYSSVEFTESQNRKRGSNRVAKHRVTTLFAEEPFAIRVAPRESRSGRRVRRIQKALSSVVTTLFLDKKSNGSMSSMRASSEDAEYRPCFFASPRVVYSFVETNNCDIFDYLLIGQFIENEIKFELRLLNRKPKMYNTTLFISSTQTTAVMTMSSIKHRRRGRPRKRLQIEAPHMTMSSPTSLRRLTVAADEPSSYRGRKRKAAMAFMKNGKDERLLDEKFLKKCGRRVMEVYSKVIKEYDERIRKEEALCNAILEKDSVLKSRPILYASPKIVNYGYKSMNRMKRPNFAKIIEKLPLRRYHTYDDSTPTRLEIPPDDLSEFITHFKITDCRNMNAQRCGVRFLPALELRPRTAYWVHTECNIRADEEHRLSHIPFVSEDHDDKQFCAELRKLYDEQADFKENSETKVVQPLPTKYNLAGPYDEDVKPFKRRQGERAPRGKPCSSHCHLIEVNGKNLVTNGKVAPFANPTLMNILVALLAGEQTSICLITAQMSMICQDIGVESRTCSEIYRLAAQLAEANPSLTPDQKKINTDHFDPSLGLMEKDRLRIKNEWFRVRILGIVMAIGSVFVRQLAVFAVSFVDALPIVECGFLAVGVHRVIVEQSSASAILRDGSATQIFANLVNDLSMDGEKCRNVPLQRGHQKLLKVGISGIAGWGCFIQETADKAS